MALKNTKYQREFSGNHSFLSVLINPLRIHFYQVLFEQNCIIPVTTTAFQRKKICEVTPPHHTFKEITPSFTKCSKFWYTSFFKSCYFWISSSKKILNSLHNEFLAIFVIWNQHLTFIHCTSLTLSEQKKVFFRNWDGVCQNKKHEMEK